MFSTPSKLPETSRRPVIESLDATLADGLDLHAQIKTAHWNIKGLHFAALHPLFEEFAVALANFNDEVAERAVTLGGVVHGSARHVAKVTRIPAYPEETTRDIELVRILADRIEAYLDSVRKARDVAERAEDTDTVDLLTGVVTEFEKNAWFLRASLEK